MSVKHYLLAITSDGLASILQRPETIRDLVELRASEVVGLGTDGVAIVSLTADSGDDPLAFIRTGAPGTAAGWVGNYLEEDGRAIECEVDMGYGPASYYRNSFLRQVAMKLQPITIDNFTATCDLDWLADNHIYPSGWRDAGRKEALLESFNRYRSCILSAAECGQHLLVWCA